MAATLKQIETVETYPDAPIHLSAAAFGLDKEAIWSRIEAWVAHRWSPRQVVWIVERDGAWSPPLTPATVTLAEVWDNGAWTATTLPAGPFGYDLPGDGPYRITATVGDGPVPWAALEAYKRLAEYSAQIGEHGMKDGKAGATRTQFEIGGDLSMTIEKPTSWAARALINSGAADLLRPYRKA